MEEKSSSLPTVETQKKDKEASKKEKKTIGGYEHCISKEDLDTNQTYIWLQNLKTTRNDESKYRNKIFHNKALTKLAGIYIWPNEKEYTECMGGIHAVFPHISGEMRDNSKVVCYCIGDGHRPQLAAAVSALTKWSTVFSIDPVLASNSWKNRLETRVQMRKQKAEEFDEIVMDAPLSIVIGVHSHHDFSEFWNRLPSPAVGVAIPCCVDQVVEGLDPIEEYRDLGIVSTPCNGVKVWKK